MKHLPFLFFALLSAQLVAARSWVNKKHFEVGIAAGAGINSAFQVPRNSPLRMEWDDKLYPAINVSVAYTSESWQYGVNAGYNSVSCKLADLGAGTNIHFNSGRETFITRPSAISYTYIPTRLFVNKLFRSGKVRYYSGLSAGAVFPLKTDRPSDVMTRKMYGIGTQTNVTAGLQTGVAIPLNKVAAFNAGIEANFVNINKGYYVYSFPLTIGLNFKL